jgi:hypothetical protein
MAEQSTTAAAAPLRGEPAAPAKPAPAPAPEKKVDAFKAGAEAAQARADQAADQSEVQKAKGGGLASNDLMAGEHSTVNQPAPAAAKDTTRAARLMLRAAKAMAKHPGLGSLVGSADTWGLVGLGDEVVGHFVLIDLDTLEKVVVGDRWVIDEDKVFANAQQWPKALVQGDVLKQVAGG